MSVSRSAKRSVSRQKRIHMAKLALAGTAAKIAATIPPIPYRGKPDDHT